MKVIVTKDSLLKKDPVLVCEEIEDDENIKVFKDTERLCKTNPMLSESIKKATAAQQLILEDDALAEKKKDLYKDAAKLVVSRNRTLEAASGCYYLCRT